MAKYERYVAILNNIDVDEYAFGYRRTSGRIIDIGTYARHGDLFLY